MPVRRKENRPTCSPPFPLNKLSKSFVSPPELAPAQPTSGKHLRWKIRAMRLFKAVCCTAMAVVLFLTLVFLSQNLLLQLMQPRIQTPQPHHPRAVLSDVDAHHYPSVRQNNRLQLNGRRSSISERTLLISWFSMAWFCCNLLSSFSFHASLLSSCKIDGRRGLIPLGKTHILLGLSDAGGGAFPNIS
jgi:hypothetical protein